MKKDLCIVVREVGERTTDLCCGILKEAFPDASIHRIFEIPFSKAVRKCFEIGIKEKKPWTLVTDADVLVHIKNIRVFFNYVKSLSDNGFRYNCVFLDKIMRLFRPGGIHLYRTKYLSTALRYADGGINSLRPENFVMLEMDKIGYKNNIIKIPVAVHDYFQYYKDLARKGFLHTLKHGGRAKILVSHWKKWAETDPDFKALLIGQQQAINYRGPVIVDSIEIGKIINDSLNQSGLIEKSQIDEFNSSIIEKMISKHMSKETPLQNQLYKKFGVRKWLQLSY